MGANADDIRRQMQQTRRRARAEAVEVVESARQLGDWRFYPRQFPWATLGTAAVLAFAEVTTREAEVRPDSEPLEKLDRGHTLHMDAQGQSEPAQKGVAAALLATAGTALLRYGVSYATQQLGQRFNDTWSHQANRERTA